MHEYPGYCQTGNQQLEMAAPAIGLYDVNCLYYCFGSVSNSLLIMWDWQLILVYITLALAVGFLLRKYLWSASGTSRKKSAGGDCGSGDCGCG